MESQSKLKPFPSSLLIPTGRGISSISSIHLDTSTSATKSHGVSELVKEDCCLSIVPVSHGTRSAEAAARGASTLIVLLEGIQAQTLSVFQHALEAKLALLAVINKVDLSHASPAETSEQIATSLGLAKEKHMRISAKSGLGVDEVLKQIVEGLPAPKRWGNEDGKLRGLIFDT